ncbi:MAG: FHA domain-containing protein [Microcoleus anatoxicus]|uniref:FHA domain-containing protein n=1 Tax=Microcoleus anatoxicus PTRS2 TaxID=2705321 RepID=A0ABU8YQI3_9CYAN|nr:MAG: FHA domain-containing protein [Oscillatoriales cyanobacterium]TAD96157.1 MAG: FHA domain-containing protein [Oscillatoriales cyanobacterium]TAE03943.1 MAG: FHA domain-containing protein [Oscillatoriales cyanobacterium]TAF01844.1 MAG: FHA domain-containing protein [Oscillatoriales cyanobacterium]TAF44333.1 MAG: FHA domain-containing protein [Oscillatoriales cyanobacterium]
MIKLTLLHPLQSIPVRSWTFEDEEVVCIGRSTESHVVLFSAVVSRRHIELRRSGKNWELINLGTNGTYLDGQPIASIPIVDGLIVHLARSGPKIQINFVPNQPSVQVEKISISPRDAKAISNPLEAAQIVTIPIPQTEITISREEDDLTEGENTRDYTAQ